MSKARVLIEDCADIDCWDTNGTTPLHTSCVRKYSELANLLIEKRADVNIVDKHGRSALNLACEHNFTDIIPTLLKEGADPFAGTGLLSVLESCARFVSFNLARSGRCAACGTPHPFHSLILVLVMGMVMVIIGKPYRIYYHTGKEATMTCQRCHIARYCQKSCQAADWKRKDGRSYREVCGDLKGSGEASGRSKTSEKEYQRIIKYGRVDETNVRRLTGFSPFFGMQVEGREVLLGQCVALQRYACELAF
jgi:hypothetical protein